ncbi:ribosomal RNA large subunit 23S methyltransferase [Dichotomocladium elegans]|nr:ribosomal RNA large subunit 23S methyltransferase [Dichotomocladium elegans]
MLQRAWYSSKAWIARQSRDPYVKAAKSNHFRARSAFKLLQIDQKYRLLSRGQVVIDLGAAPGGFTQVATRKGAQVIAVDLLPMDPIPGADIVRGDFMRPLVRKQVLELVRGRPVNLVCSDMAPSFSGNHIADHSRSIELCEMSLHFAQRVLAPGGVFIAKVLMGGDEVAFRQKLKGLFQHVKQEKPDASRKQSTEFFIVATGYKGSLIEDNA